MRKMVQVAAQTVALLEEGSMGLFRVLGSRDQTIGADELIGAGKSVYAIAASGAFPPQSAASRGDVEHQFKIILHCIVGATSKNNKAVLVDPTTTMAEKAAAIALTRKASVVADEQLKEVMCSVYGIIMDARNGNLGCDRLDVPFTIRNRFISKWHVSDVSYEGEYALMEGILELDVVVKESVGGETPYVPLTGLVLDGTIRYGN